MPDETAGSSGVKVTVIVAVYNPGNTIEALIASLAGQSLSPASWRSSSSMMARPTTPPNGCAGSPANT